MKPTRLRTVFQLHDDGSTLGHEGHWSTFDTEVVNTSADSQLGIPSFWPRRGNHKIAQGKEGEHRGLSAALGLGKPHTGFPIFKTSLLPTFPRPIERYLFVHSVKRVFEFFGIQIANWGRRIPVIYQAGVPKSYGFFQGIRLAFPRGGACRLLTRRQRSQSSRGLAPGYPVRPLRGEMARAPRRRGEIDPRHSCGVPQRPRS